MPPQPIPITNGAVQGNAGGVGGSGDSRGVRLGMVVAPSAEVESPDYDNLSSEEDEPILYADDKKS